MRALAVVAIVGLGLLSRKQATAADLRVGERVIRSPGYVYQPAQSAIPTMARAFLISDPLATIL